MSFHRRRVDQHLRRGTPGGGQRMEDLKPYSFGRPAHEAIVKRLAWAVEERRIRPAATGLQHMHNAADHPPIIDARLAPSIGRQMRHEPRELTIVQPEMISIH